MAFKYKSQNEKVKEIIEKYILPAIKNKDLDYEKTLSFIASESGVSRSTAQDVLLSYIQSGRIAELHLLALPDSKLDEWIKDIKKIEKEANEIVKNEQPVQS